MGNRCTAGVSEWLGLARMEMVMGDEIGKACGDRCDCKTDQDTSRCPGAERPRAAAEPPSQGT